MSVNTTLMQGDGQITTAVQGTDSHIKCAENKNFTDMAGPWVNEELIFETQVVRIWKHGQRFTGEDTFQLQFNGHTTASLPVNTSAAEMKAALENLESDGSVNVQREDNTDSTGAEWQIEFAPSSGSSFTHMTNYGDLPAIVPVWNTTLDAQLKVYSGGTGGVSTNSFSYHDGVSPFVVDIQFAAVSDAHCTAVHQKGVTGFNGLDTGVFQSQTAFTIEARDRFSNRVEQGPLKEVQIIETHSNDTLAGTFTVAFKGSSAEVTDSETVRPVPFLFSSAHTKAHAHTHLSATYHPVIAQCRHCGHGGGPRVSPGHWSGYGYHGIC